MGLIFAKMIYKNELKCDYCYQCITNKESLFRVYSRGKYNNYMLCYRCLTDKNRRYNMSTIKTGNLYN